MRRDHSPAAGVRKGGQRRHHDDGMALVLAAVLAAAALRLSWLRRCRLPAVTCIMTSRLRALSGQVAVSRRHLPLRPAEYEHDIGLFFSRNWLDGALHTKGFVELRMNAPAAHPHRNGPTPHAGLAMSLTF